MLASQTSVAHRRRGVRFGDGGVPRRPAEAVLSGSCATAWRLPRVRPRALRTGCRGTSKGEPMKEPAPVFIVEQSCRGEAASLPRHHMLQTNGQVLVEFFKALRGTLHACLEEGTQAGWLVEILLAHVERVVTVRLPNSRGPRATSSMPLVWPNACARARSIWACTNRSAPLRRCVSSSKRTR